MNVSARLRVLSEEGARLACPRGGEGGRENMEQVLYNLNLRTVILQGERNLKKRKDKKKKSNGFSGILFSVHI